MPRLLPHPEPRASSSQDPCVPESLGPSSLFPACRSLTDSADHRREVLRSICFLKITTRGTACCCSADFLPQRVVCLKHSTASAFGVDGICFPGIILRNRHESPHFFHQTVCQCAYALGTLFPRHSSPQS